MDATLIAKVTLVGAFALIGTWLWPGRSPRLRHARWTAAFAALLMLPLVARALPEIAVPVPAALGRFSAIAKSSSLPGLSWLSWIWLAGALVALAGVLISTFRVAVLARRSTPIVDAEWLTSASRISRALGASRTPRLFWSTDVRTPMTGGAWRPVVFLPPVAAAWDAERRDIVLAHECAHVASHDALRHLGVRLAAALYWFHPLVWIAVRCAVMAREQACDQAVLGLGVRPSAYARVLVETHGAGRRAAIGALAIGDASTLEVRVRGILGNDMTPASGRAVTTSVAAVVAMSVAVAMLAPELRTVAPQLVSRIAGPDVRLASSSRARALARRKARASMAAPKAERAVDLADVRPGPDQATGAGEPQFEDAGKKTDAAVGVAIPEPEPLVATAFVPDARRSVPLSAPSVDQARETGDSGSDLRSSPTLMLDGRVEEFFYRAHDAPRDVRALSPSALGMGPNTDSGMTAYLQTITGPGSAPPQNPGWSVEGLALSNLVIGAMDVPNALRHEGGVREDVLVNATSRRDFTPTDRVAAFLRVSQSQPRRPASVDVTTSIASHTRDPVVSEALHVEPNDFGAARHVDYRYRLPVEQLVAGDYVLKIRVDAASRSAERSLRFRVR